MSIYLIRLNPGNAPPTYKVGMSKSPERRLNSIRTVQPKAVLLQIWPGGSSEEKAVIIALKNFDAGDGDTITAIGAEVFETSSDGTFMGHSGNSGWWDEDEAMEYFVEEALSL